MDAAETRETRLTRDELYQLVWSEPMHTMAPRYGISDVALKKTCVRMRVPTPGRGYWARKSAGQAVRRTPLPKLPASVPPSMLSVIFGRPPRPVSEDGPEATGPVADQERYEALPAHRITVQEVLTDPHRLVAASVHLLRKGRTDEQHRLVPSGKRCLALSVTLGSADRAMLLYDALLKALEARGYPVTLTEGEHGASTTVTVGEEHVSIMIEERVDRVERAPDAKDKRPSYFREKLYDVVPTGRLTLRLQHQYLGARQSWSDGAKQRVENCLNDFVVGIVAAAEALKQQRLEREARQREFLAAEERRRLAEQRRQEEAARVRALDASLQAWRKSVVIREYAAAMRQAAEAAGLLGEGAPMTAWLAWVEEYADRVDPTRPTPSVPADPDPHRWHYAPGGTGSTTDARPLW